MLHWELSLAVRSGAGRRIGLDGCRRLDGSHIHSTVARRDFVDRLIILHRRLEYKDRRTCYLLLRKSVTRRLDASQFFAPPSLRRNSS